MDLTRVAPSLALLVVGSTVLPSIANAEVLEFVMTLDGSQQNPVIDTPGTGSGVASLDTDTNLFSWDVTFSGLLAAQTAAHFHGPAEQCEPGGIAIPLPVGSPIVGSSTVTAQQATQIMDGLWYLNVHSSMHPGGEIRGQVMPAPTDDPLPDPVPPGGIHLQLDTIVDGLTAPNWGANAPGDDRLFVVDQVGILWAVDLDAGTKSVFLDVSALLVDLGIFGKGTFDERGFLGVAFHPEYQSNGLLYTYTSEPADAPADFSTIPAGSQANHQAVIREWAVPDPSNADSVVDPGSTRVLMRIDEPQFNHNAGCVNFGPDGMLYIALGDGGGGDDKDGQVSLGAPMIGHGCIGNGQDFTNPLGSILRIDPLGTNAANGSYGVPADNPFVGSEGLDEIFAYGFRNPFRFSFDRETGELYAGDVGQNDIEEVDIVVSGGNYGWNAKEGSFFFVANGKMPGYVTDRALVVPPDLIEPIAQYDHSEGIAIVGGFVYRGTRIPAMAGRYVFGEFAVTFASDGRLFYLDGANQILEIQLVGQKGFGFSLLGMGEDGSGELYAMVNLTGIPFGETGAVIRLAPKTGDTNADGVVNVSDLINVISDWNTDGSANGGDVNGDGVVNVTDLVTVITAWN